MSNLKDSYTDERDEKIVKATLDGVKNLLKPINKNITKISQFLESKFSDYSGLAESMSQKKITERGRKLIEKHNVSSYLVESCPLLKDDGLKEKTDTQIFMTAWEWIEKNGKEKVFEILLNCNDSENSIKEVLALAILEKIKSENKSLK